MFTTYCCTAGHCLIICLVLALCELPAGLSLQDTMTSHSYQHDFLRGGLQHAGGTNPVASCPYGRLGPFDKDGTSSYQCHNLSPSFGSSCPALQGRRLQAARSFAAANHGPFVAAAKKMQVHPLFDKSSRMVGDETYEKLDRYQIDGLMNDDPRARRMMYQLEDKINLKAFAKSIGVQTTKTFFGAHRARRDHPADAEHQNTKYDRNQLRDALEKMCNDEDEFIIKPTHLAWGTGFKKVESWKTKCASKEKDKHIAALIDHVENEILAKENRPADAHLELLAPGFTVEELFKTGGRSAIPFEVKAVCLFGKLFLMYMNGQDDRGCDVAPGSWVVYGNGELGWDLAGAHTGGLSKSTKDKASRKFMQKFFRKAKAIAERFASKVGADLFRVDMFIGGFGEKETPNIKVNEVESVTGNPFPLERQVLGELWRDGYVANGRVAMDTPKWEQLIDNMREERDAVGGERGRDLGARGASVGRRRARKRCAVQAGERGGPTAARAVGDASF